MSWKKIGDAASAISKRLEDKRGDYHGRTPRFFGLRQEAIDGGVDPRVLIVFDSIASRKSIQRTTTPSRANSTT